MPSEPMDRGSRMETPILQTSSTTLDTRAAFTRPMPRRAEFTAQMAPRAQKKQASVRIMATAPSSTAAALSSRKSWAMGRAKEGDAWFTVMGNVNAVAVAALADCACIVLCHGASLDAVAKTRAEEQGINIFTTDLPEFEAGFALARAMKL